MFDNKGQSSLRENASEIAETAVQAMKETGEAKLEHINEDIEELQDEIKQRGWHLKHHAAELYAEDNKVSNEPVALPVRILGIISIVVGVITVPFDIFFIVVLAIFLSNAGLPEAFDWGVSTQALVLNFCDITVNLILTIGFIIFGVRLLRNKRTGAAHNGVIYHHHAFARHHARNCLQLYFHLVNAVFLAGRNKGAANVFVFDEANFIRNTRFHGIPQCGIKTRIGHTNYNVGINRVRFC